MRSFAVLLFLVCSLAAADSPAIYSRSASAPLDVVYDRVYKALENDRFFVVFEANIGSNLARFKDRWGEDYNRSGLDGIRSMVVCNPWYTNQLSNADPGMLALCPLSVTLVSKSLETTVLFARPTAMAGDSPAGAVLEEVEQAIISAIEKGLSDLP